MIGTILGIINAFAFVGVAFSRELELGIFLASLVGWTLIGIILFPRTVGTMLGWVQFSSPIAIIGGGLANGWGIFFGSIGVLIAATIASIVIALIRPDSV